MFSLWNHSSSWGRNNDFVRKLSEAKTLFFRTLCLSFNALKESPVNAKWKWMHFRKRSSNKRRDFSWDNAGENWQGKHLTWLNNLLDDTLTECENRYTKVSEIYKSILTINPNLSMGEIWYGKKGKLINRSFFLLIQSKSVENW